MYIPHDPTIIYYVYNPEISGTMYSRHHMKVCSLKYCFAIEENRKQSVCSIRKRVDNWGNTIYQRNELIGSKFVDVGKFLKTLHECKE